MVASEFVLNGENIYEICPSKLFPKQMEVVVVAVVVLVMLFVLVSWTQFPCSRLGLED